MNPLAKIAEVARRYVGLRETIRNRGPHLAEFWTATSYLDGQENREPWCCAFVVYCIRQAVVEFPTISLRFPPDCAAVAELERWAGLPANGCETFAVSQGGRKPLAGDIVSFLPHFSHIGIVAEDYDGTGIFYTVEGNTNNGGSREGDGVYLKSRFLMSAGKFIRLPALAI